MKKEGNKSSNIINSFNHAVNGLIYSLLSQKNMRVHYAVAFSCLIATLFFNLTKVEFAIVFMSIMFVILSELFNTAIESTVDLVTSEYHPLAKIAKDVSAGAVVVSVINAVVIGYIIFFDKINPITLSVLTKIRHQEIHIVFVILFVILFAVIGLKTYTKTGTPMQGGFVSGHSSVAFGLSTAISLISNNTLISTMSFMLAFLVSQSRVEGKIHTKREVILGAVLGVSVTLIVFYIFKI